MTGSARIVRGNALALPLDDSTVDLVVTSPPYFGLRSYQDGGEHYAGQIGDEATPAEFVDALIAATREMMRVLKPSGSIWVNLGDKYASVEQRRLGTDGVRQKSLLGIPWRYAIRCIDELGLILRAEVIWSKPNGLPESVTDRVRRSHETWFCFEQSGGVEAQAQSFPFCPLCGRPVDARATLVKRLQEVDRGVVSLDLSDEMRTQESVESDGSGCTDLDVRGVARRASVPVLREGDAASVEDSADLLEDGVAAVEDEHPKVRVPVRGAGESHGALPIQDAGQPSEFCDCVGHPLIIDDEPWLPQSLAADIMQRVADGEIDPQQAADFLSGDYVRNHSVWFHFTKQPRYFSAVDEIREPHLAPNRSGTNPKHESAPFAAGIPAHTSLSTTQPNPLGKLPGSVWTIPTQPLRVPDHLGIDHFAAFPMEWPRRIIRGWSPREVCSACGEGRRPVVDVEQVARRPIGVQQIHTAMDARADKGTKSNVGHVVSSRTITGEACACPEPTAATTPGVVLDPFGGTGTTALVAKVLGRHGISVDMSADYCRLATWRTTDPDQIARAMQVDKPARQVAGQADLFDHLEAAP